MFRSITLGSYLLAMMAALSASAQNVKVTPPGTQTGDAPAERFAARIA